MRGLWLGVVFITVAMTAGTTYLATRPTSDQLLATRIYELQARANMARIQAERSKQEIERLERLIYTASERSDNLRTLQDARNEARYAFISDLNTSLAALYELRTAQKEALRVQ